ncbi:YraN family protein [Corynebacterium yudongzhengii]|uniref:UPF0102 protein DF222_06865 n=1 Tax=Corynebacterium yudongzhengii TaxID=2080740 RepID=A0A2U1T6B9_9CORY|nr:YraN family protein [Corynebacterium yudongzhengii]AWB81684.1 YraN family protein [Corynebacterium yudongzhengii]PWC01513.1 YraN family protein [Corynebacterium yudongzhengii]
MTMSNARQALGRRGEALASSYLNQRGYRIIDRNVSYDCGEIDLIAVDGDEVVFVEVKTRSHDGFGGAEAVDRRKLSRLRRAAARWLQGRPPTIVRFDVLELITYSPGMSIEHYRGIEDAAC